MSSKDGGIAALNRDIHNVSIQGFCPNPSYSMVPVSITAGSSVTLGVSGAEDYDMTEWISASFFADGVLDRHFNTDTTKTRTMPEDTENVLLISPLATTITLTNNTATAIILEIEGM